MDRSKNLHSVVRSSKSRFLAHTPQITIMGYDFGDLSGFYPVCEQRPHSRDKRSFTDRHGQRPPSHP